MSKKGETALSFKRQGAGEMPGGQKGRVYLPTRGSGSHPRGPGPAWGPRLAAGGEWGHQENGRLEVQPLFFLISIKHSHQFQVFNISVFLDSICYHLPSEMGG